MKQTSRFQILKLMFWGHFTLFILVSLLTHFKGFDKEEYDEISAILLVFLFVHGYRLIEGSKNSINELIIVFGYQKLVILFFLSILAGIFTLKGLAPQVINFKESLISFGIFELIFHVIVFFIHVIGSSKSKHFS